MRLTSVSVSEGGASEFSFGVLMGNLLLALVLDRLGFVCVFELLLSSD